MSERYTRIREIGRGGMGAVWLARDTVLGREVAIKQVGLFPGADEADYERALREARTAAALRHPGVVAVFDLVEEPGHHWLVMEYVDSRNLSQLVRADGALSPDQTAHILAPVADALAAAHEAGVVHRDVKPGNILVRTDGVAKIADFGIARRTTDAALTQTGLLSGSPAYLPPEVAEGASAGPAADVWSLGATAFFALTGRPPYDGKESALATLYQVIHEPVPSLPEAGWLAPLVAGSLVKDPSARWSMPQVARFLESHGREGAPAPVGALQPEAVTRTIPAIPAGAEEPVAASARGLAPARAVEEPPAEARRRGSMIGWLLAAAAVALLALVGFLVVNALSGTANPTTDAAAQHPPTTPSRSPSHTSTPRPSHTPRPTATPTALTGAQMGSFVRSYVATVVADPARGWPQLTPAFQAQSGGFSGYHGFWSTIAQASVQHTVTDPAAGTVTYTVAYVKKDGSRFTSTSTLSLIRQGGSILINGER